MGLDTVELIIWVEKTFDIQVNDSEAAQIRMVGELVALIHRVSLARHGSQTPAKSVIFQRMQDFLASRYGVAPERIRADSRFVDDLGLE